MRRRINRAPQMLVTDLRETPIEIAGVTARSLRLDTREFHEPLERDLIGLGLLELTDRRRGGRGYMQRLQVNYLRHTSVNAGAQGYRELLDHGIERLGFYAAYDEINQRILGAIADRVPHLRDACESQRREAFLVEPEDIFRPYMRADSDERLPLSSHGASTVASRSDQQITDAMLRVPVMTEANLVRFAALYDEVLRGPSIHSGVTVDDQIALDEAMVVQYLRDRALGLDRRNVSPERYLLGAHPDSERLVLFAIARMYPALKDECERRVRSLERSP